MPKSNPQDSSRGKLKIFLGFAPGVGKTYSMLDEAHRRASRGQDIVAAMIETHGRTPIQGLLDEFEVVPPLSSGEIDVEAVIARAPETILVDDLAHPNPPGAKRANRWEDVDMLLASGINVLATVNVQSIESLNDHVSEIIGHRVKDTVPDSILHEAEEVELIDLTPRALINRLERGDIFPSDRIPSERTKLFQEGKLSALREIAMREAASRIDEDVAEYRKENRIEKPWATKDKVMICISPTRSSLRLIRRGFRIGQRLHGEVIAVHVEDGTSASEKGKQILQDDFALAERLGIKTIALKGNLSPSLIKFAKEQNVTAIILGHPERSRFQEVMKASVLSDLARELRAVDIIVVATELPEELGLHS